jgi:hypothetical protein
LLSEDERNKQLMWIDKEYYGVKSHRLPISMEEPYELLIRSDEPEPRRNEVVERTRIIPMNTHIVDDIPDEAG